MSTLDWLTIATSTLATLISLDSIRLTMKTRRTLRETEARRQARRRGTL